MDAAPCTDEPAKDIDLSAEKAILAEVVERVVKQRRPGWTLTVSDKRMTLAKDVVEHSKHSRSFVYISDHLNMGDEQGRGRTLSCRIIAKDGEFTLQHRPVDEIVQNLVSFMDCGARSW